MPDPLQPSLVLTPLRPAAPASGGTLEVLIRVQAPDRPVTEDDATATRQPLRLAVVVDRSGSMSGAPLREALRCAEYIAGGLQRSDQLAVVLYDDAVQVAYPLQPGGDARAVQKALAGVQSGGSTALFDGWEQGAKLLESGTAKSISRVLLLSDGQANHGLCDAADIQRHCSKRAQWGVTTTTVGLGSGFNEELMIGMGQAGGGRHYYGRTAEDLHDSFNEKLSLLKSLFLRKLRIKLVPAAGVIPEPLGFLLPMVNGFHPLPDLAWGAEAWMLVRLHISPPSSIDPRTEQDLLAVVAQGEPEDGARQTQLHAMLRLPFVGESDLHGLAIDELVARRLKELEFADATAAVHEMVAEGDIKAATALLRQLSADVANHPWLAEKVLALGKLIEEDQAVSLKEMRYSMLRTSQRLVAKSEAEYIASETESVDIPAFLRRKVSEGRGRKNTK